MWRWILGTFYSFLVIVSVLVSLKSTLTIPEVRFFESEFADFLVKYSKSYPPDDYQKRFEIFTQNLFHIHSINSRNFQYTFGVNEFTDLTTEEFTSFYLSPSKKISPKFLPPLSNLKVPNIVNWTANGAVTEVKSQGLCPASYAFATTGALEGAWKISKNFLISLSEQDIIDCSSSIGNNGCVSGKINYSLEFVSRYGIASEKNYPYTQFPSLCNSEIPDAITANSIYYESLQNCDNLALEIGVTNSPVAVEVNATSWQMYSGGVFHNPCDNSVNFNALVVGFDLSALTPFLIVKSSWGVSWGIQGYIHLEILPGCGNSCINSNPIVPLVQA